MYIDARTLSPNTTIDTEICIIGGGAAGITLALELLERPFRVCILESGGLEYDEETQNLYKGENIGLPYFPLDGTRLRYFGGTTNHWTGWCRPLDDIDFEARAWVRDSGWPIERTDLIPYYKKAHTLCQLDSFEYSVDYWEKTLGNNVVSPLALHSDRVVTKIFQFSPPTRFGTVYQKHLRNASNMRIFLNSNVINIETNKNASRVERVHVRTLKGNKFWVKSKYFILAAGGLENPRLLLASNNVQKSGLGNQHFLVGKYFTEHIEMAFGYMLLQDNTTNMDLYTLQKHGILGSLAINEQTQRMEKLLNFNCTIVPIANAGAGTAGFGSLRHLFRSVEEGKWPDNLGRHIKNIISDYGQVSSYLYDKLVAKQKPGGLYLIMNRSEQSPKADSKVILGEETDALGMRRIQLNWRLSPIDKYTIRRSQEILGEELGRAGLGRVRIMLSQDDTTWPPNLDGGHHHMGTTRMSDKPKTGVVDKNLKVFGTENLFVAGSSVFPSCGNSNPTLTIIALSIRMAEHVNRLMS